MKCSVFHSVWSHVSSEQLVYDVPDCVGVNELINLSGRPYQRERGWAGSLNNCLHHQCHINLLAGQGFQLGLFFRSQTEVVVVTQLLNAVPEGIQ